MKMTNVKKSLSLFLCFVLIAVMALFTTGCNDSKVTEENSTEAVSQAEIASDAEAVKVGEGSTSFTFTVTFTDGSKKAYLVSTDKTTVGEALLDAGLIAGEDSEYGLYVKTVDGVTLDYETDGKYWAFYVDGAYGSTGVDSTDITAGSSYEFKAE